MGTGNGNFTSGEVYTIIKTGVAITGTAGVGGVSLWYTDGSTKTVVADGSGNYTIVVPAGWSGVVTPYKSGYTFTPSNKSYSNLQSSLAGQDYTAQTCGVGCADTNAWIGGQLKGSYTVAPGGRITPQYAGVFNGPVRVNSTNGVPFLTTERALYGNSFNESIGLPTSQLKTEYWYPWYDDVYMGTWITVGNPSPSLTASVDIYIAGSQRGSYSIPPNGQITPDFPGVFDGPLQVISTGVTPVPVFTSARSLYQGSFTDILGYPASDFASEYWFPWYRYDAGLQTWISVANPSASASANVDIYIAGQKVASQSILPKGRWTPNFVGVSAGPVRVVSTNVGPSVPILVSERLLYKNSFNEIFGIAPDKMTNEYYLSWFDSMYMTSQLLVGNPSASASANVDIYIAGNKVGSQSIAPGQTWVSTYPNQFNGPVKVVSTNVGPSVPIFVSEQSIYNTSFEESVGYPVNQLSSEYWFLWYDQVYMQTWVTIGVP